MYAFLFIALTMVGHPSIGPIPPATTIRHRSPATSPHPTAPEILKYVNQYRHSKHLRPLEANSFISSIALEHSRNMASGKTRFGHDGFKQRIDRIKKRFKVLHVAAENVASGPMSAREVVDGWLHSPGHRKNIEGDFKYTGIGLVGRRDGMIYFTQIFSR